MHTDDDPTLPLPARRSGNALPDGTQLAEFQIRGTVGEGGFGIVYMAWDGVLKRQVAIKEYVPWSLAGRVGSRVLPSSDSAVETFELGLRSFINEAQLLASFDHPSLLKVYRFWEDNGTAYMVMPFYRGVTLKRALAKLGAAPEEGWLKQQLGHLFDALEVMHAASCFHRDIAPDNILLLDEGIPLLLDFGAARRVLSDRTQTLTAFLKPGYAPVEQYAVMPHMKQGPWTDLYALASVVYYAITGHAPTTSVERVMGDELASLASLAGSRYGAAFLTAIDTTLAVRPKDRPQDVAAFCELLNHGLPPGSPAGFRLSGFQSSGFDPLGGPIPRFDPAPADATTLLLPPGATVQPSPPAVASPSRGPRMTRTLALAGAAALGVAALAFYFGTRSVPPEPSAAREPRPDSAPTPTRPATQSAEPTPAPTAPTELAPAPTTAAAYPASAAAPSASTVSAPAAAVATPAAQPSKAAASLPIKREAKSKPAAAAAAPRSEAPPRNAGVNAARCSDILQKASLEPIADEEAAYLRKECR